jgi:ComEC/Rec2-related protein
VYKKHIVIWFFLFVLLFGSIFVKKNPSECLDKIEKNVALKVIEIQGKNRFVLSFGGQKILFEPNIDFNVSLEDKIFLVGNLEKIKSTYSDYFVSKNIFCEISFYKDLEILKVFGVGDIFAYLRKETKLFFDQNFNQNQSSIIQAMIIGDDSGLNYDEKAKYRKLGLSHIMVLSGFNITLFVFFVTLILFKIKRKKRYIFALLAGWFLILLSGSSSSAVRSGIMFSFVLFGKLIFKFVNPLRTVFLSLIFMSIFWPLAMMYDAGFHLSFLATFGILVLGNKIKEFLWLIPDKISFREHVSTTLGAQIATWPYIFYFFNTPSWVSIPANLIVGLVVAPLSAIFYLIWIISFIYKPIAIFLVIFVGKPAIFLYEKLILFFSFFI